MGPTTTAGTALQGNNYEAYLVGGTVRDLLLGRTPKDIDLTTNATPDQMLELFQSLGMKVIPTGLQHGTVTVLDPLHGPVEITTYRTDGTYTDARRPDTVQFSTSLEEDLKRRDFTINAIATLHGDPAGLTVDPHGGHLDLAKRLIRCVGDPKTRFMEDALRTLRAARFSAQLDFDIHSGTRTAMSDPEVHERLALVSKERIRDELLKAMASPNPRRFIETLIHTGLNTHVLPELNPMAGMAQPTRYHAHDVLEHSLQAMEACPADDPTLRFIGIMHDVGKPYALDFKDDGTPTFRGHDDIGAHRIKTVMTRLKFPNKDIDRAMRLIRHHLVYETPRMTDKAVRKLVDRVGEDLLDDLYILRRADLLAHGTTHARETLTGLDRLWARIASLKAQHGTAGTPKLALTGHDIMQHGVKQGPGVGEALAHLASVVVVDPSQNTVEGLTGALETYLQGANRKP